MCKITHFLGFLDLRWAGHLYARHYIVKMFLWFALSLFFAIILTLDVHGLKLVDDKTRPWKLIRGLDYLLQLVNSQELLEILLIPALILISLVSLMCLFYSCRFIEGIEQVSLSHLIHLSLVSWHWSVFLSFQHRHELMRPFMFVKIVDLIGHLMLFGCGRFYGSYTAQDVSLVSLVWSIYMELCFHALYTRTKNRQEIMHSNDLTFLMYPEWIHEIVSEVRNFSQYLAHSLHFYVFSQISIMFNVLIFIGEKFLILT